MAYVQLQEAHQKQPTVIWGKKQKLLGETGKGKLPFYTKSISLRFTTSKEATEGMMYHQTDRDTTMPIHLSPWLQGDQERKYCNSDSSIPPK
uniref:Uncharacterized protein n=1 Tax=Apteryx owenii TaxID=8824 RepID=A0A8B9Q2E6_APTOW